MLSRDVRAVTGSCVTADEYMLYWVINGKAAEEIARMYGSTAAHVQEISTDFMGRWCPVNNLNSMISERERVLRAATRVQHELDIARGRKLAATAAAQAAWQERFDRQKAAQFQAALEQKRATAAVQASEDQAAIAAIDRADQERSARAEKWRAYLASPEYAERVRIQLEEQRAQVARRRELAVARKRGRLWMFFEGRKNLGRPIDMGGGRDQWLEFTPESAFA